jgi:L-ribulose-5-phosphate 3-epimerase
MVPHDVVRSVVLLGYNTNGFGFHRLEDAIEIIADLGYRSVAITLDHHALNPFEPDFAAACEATRRQLDRLHLASVIETGARFLLDPRRKHEPTLLTPEAAGRRRRIEFLCRAVDAAAALGSRAVSFWAGIRRPEVAPADARRWLLDGCRALADYADRRRVALAFEPEPGMLVETVAGARALRAEIGHPRFGLTVDVGHLVCTGEVPVSERLAAVADCVFNVHLEDMRRGAHEHLFFGEGEADFADIFAGLRRLPPATPVHVELSRHSADAVETARKAMTFLKHCTGG